MERTVGNPGRFFLIGSLFHWRIDLLSRERGADEIDIDVVIDDDNAVINISPFFAAVNGVQFEEKSWCKAVLGLVPSGIEPATADFHYMVSRRLGHANASITMNTYGHLMPGFKREAADLMDSPVTLIDLLVNWLA